MAVRCGVAEVETVPKSQLAQVKVSFLGDGRVSPGSKQKDDNSNGNKEDTEKV